VRCGGTRFAPGQLFLLTADADDRAVTPDGPAPVTLLRSMLPA
jgi:hypothetical protein